MSKLSDVDRYIVKPFVKGLIRLLILGVLSKGESYAYQIYRHIVDLVKSRVSLSTFYTILKDLEVRGFVVKVDGKYVLTEKGLLAITILLAKYPYLAQILSSLKR